MTDLKIVIEKRGRRVCCRCRVCGCEWKQIECKDKYCPGCGAGFLSGDIIILCNDVKDEPDEQSLPLISWPQPDTASPFVKPGSQTSDPLPQPPVGDTTRRWGQEHWARYSVNYHLVTDEEIAWATAEKRGWDTAAKPGELATWFHDGKHTGYSTRAIKAEEWDRERGFHRMPVWDPANHIEQAVELLDELLSRGKIERVKMTWEPDFWTAWLEWPRHGIFEGADREKGRLGCAICLAVLKAKEER